jgi:hypothetical protein
VGLIPARPAAVLGILTGCFIGGCASDPGERAPELAPTEPPRPIALAVEPSASLEPASLSCEGGLLAPWFEATAPGDAGADTGQGVQTIDFASSPGRPRGRGVLEVRPVQAWLDEASGAGDTDPAEGLLAAINTDGPIDLAAIVSPAAGEGLALVLRGRAERLQFRDGAGLRYLAAFTGDYAPLTDANLYYLFEGVTRDGRRYVSLRLPLGAAALPDVPEQGTLEAAAEFAAITDVYVASVRERLDRADPASFRPPLDRLDEFVRSISVR